MEAMIWYNDSLFLFSKNRTSPYDGWTKLYKLPTIPGTFVAQLVDSFQTNTLNLFEGSATAADISPNEKSIALISYSKIWLFTDFSGSNFLSGDITTINVTSLSQREGICFVNDTEVYMTDEQIIAGVGGKLYYLDLEPFFPQPECTQPSGVSITNITNQSAKVSWDGDTLAEIWQIQYRIHPTFGGGGMGTRIAGAGSTFKTLTGLNQGTLYQLRMRKGCGALGLSPFKFASFNTSPFVLLSKPQIVLYPNPAGNRLHIGLHDFNEKTATIEILNIHGEIIRTNGFEGGDSLTTFFHKEDLHDLPAGVYFVKIKYGDTQIVRKFLLSNTN
jgi:hypothetical protein